MADSPQTEDYKNTIKFLHSYGRKVVNVVKQRINGGHGYTESVDTGALLRSIDYKIKFTPKTFSIKIFMGSDVINFQEDPLDPATYGFFLDEGTRYIEARGFLSDAIQGLTTDFHKNINEEIAKDWKVWIDNQAKEMVKGK